MKDDSNATPADSRTPEHVFARRVMVAVGTGMAAVLLVLLLWYTAQVITLLFASILLAVILSAPSDALAERTRMPREVALGIVMLGLFLFFSLFGFSLGRTVYTQVRELKTSLPGAIHALEEDVKKSPWIQRFSAKPVEESAGTDPATATASTEPEGDAGRELAGLIARAEAYATELSTSERFYTSGLNTLSAGVGVVGSGIVIFAIALFLALDPGAYVKGFVALFPISRRERTRVILGSVGVSLQWWFLGQLCSMVAVGTLTCVGLLILGVPAALTLSMLAGLMTFIPNFGPIIAAIPAVLIALAPHGGQTQVNGHLALNVIILYLLVQLADGWAITPLIQKRALAMPPALIMLAQVTLLLLLGMMGLLMATPILAAVIVLIRMMYVEDVLGDRSFPVKAGPLERKKRG